MSAAMTVVPTSTGSMVAGTVGAVDVDDGGVVVVAARSDVVVVDASAA